MNEFARVLSNGFVEVIGSFVDDEGYGIDEVLDVLSDDTCNFSELIVALNDVEDDVNVIGVLDVDE